jgi:hypothetical protein
MTIAPNADIIGALTAKLRATTEVTALASTRIAGEVGSDWFTPGGDARGAVRLRRTGGNVDPELWGVGIHVSRVDCNCYGSSGRTANLLLATVLAVLCPDMSNRAAFTQTLADGSKVRVYDVMPEVDVIVYREIDTGYRFAWVPLSVRWSAIAG